MTREPNNSGSGRAHAADLSISDSGGQRLVEPAWRARVVTTRAVEELDLQVAYLSRCP